MSATLIEVGARRVMLVAEDGPALGTETDAADLVGEALGHQAQMVAVPVARLSPDFFRLHTTMAGFFVQKLVNYGLELAVVGDISEPLAESQALRAYVAESGRGRHLVFAPSLEALEARLA